jgi:hypothetical protein
LDRGQRLEVMLSIYAREQHERQIMGNVVGWICIHFFEIVLPLHEWGVGVVADYRQTQYWADGCSYWTRRRAANREG